MTIWQAHFVQAKRLQVGKKIPWSKVITTSFYLSNWKQRKMFGWNNGLSFFHIGNHLHVSRKYAAWTWPGSAVHSQNSDIIFCKNKEIKTDFIFSTVLAFFGEAKYFPQWYVFLPQHVGLQKMFFHLPSVNHLSAENAFTSENENCRKY